MIGAVGQDGARAVVIWTAHLSRRNVAVGDLAMASQVVNPSPGTTPHSTGPEPTRRDLLQLIQIAGAGLFAVAAAWALTDSMNPSADVIAAGEPLDVDLTKLAPGQQIVVLWRGTPIFVTNRPPPALKVLQEASLVERLSDPNSDVHQQAPYAQNWHRSIKPEFAVLVGICTHLGCPPGVFADARSIDPGRELARRLFLPVPWLEIRSRGQSLPGECRRRTICRCHLIIFRMIARFASARTHR